METHDDSYGTGAPVHPAFAAHFTDPLYDDPAGEFAPFGSDEGADLLAEWSDRPGDLREDSTLRRLLAEAFADPSDLDDVLGGMGGPPTTTPVTTWTRPPWSWEPASPCCG